MLRELHTHACKHGMLAIIQLTEQRPQTAGSIPRCAHTWVTISHSTMPAMHLHQSYIGMTTFTSILKSGVDRVRQSPDHFCTVYCLRFIRPRYGR